MAAPSLAKVATHHQATATSVAATTQPFSKSKWHTGQQRDAFAARLAFASFRRRRRQRQGSQLAALVAADVQCHDQADCVHRRWHASGLSASNAVAQSLRLKLKRSVGRKGHHAQHRQVADQHHVEHVRGLASHVHWAHVQPWADGTRQQSRQRSQEEARPTADFEEDGGWPQVQKGSKRIWTTHTQIFKRQNRHRPSASNRYRSQ